MFRHTTALHLLRSGADINTIPGLGHVSIDTSNIFAGVDLGDEAKALNACAISQCAVPKPGLMAFLRSL